MSYTIIAILLVAIVLTELFFVRKGKITLQDIRELASFVVITLLLFFGIKHFLVQPFLVDGRSMSPNFETGNYLIVDRLSYRLDEPKRFHVVVFEFPKDPARYFIKRIIALPGERVTVRDGVTKVFNEQYKDGLIIEEPYLVNTSNKDVVDLTLGPTEYFVMGDNRLESYDSRIWGALDRSFISGRALVRLYPFTEIELYPADLSDFKQP
jgi:signal peptidase I